jgi:gliding motility-associated lipoprotein GldH
MKSFYSIIGLVFLFIACTEDRYFENNIDFNDRVWEMDESAEFEFEIDSTTLPYQIKLNLRNSLDYPYRNLYIKYQLLDSTQLIADKLMDIKLFEAKNGKPFGSRQSDIYSHQLILQDSVFFPEKGTYKIALSQYMREKELKGIISVGIKIDQLK